MTDPSRRGGWEQEHPGTHSYPVEPGETYGRRRPYGSDHQPRPSDDPTRQLPAYASYGYEPAGAPGPPGGPPPQPPEPPRGGGSRTWLWILAGGALLLVVGLIFSLFIDNSSREPMGSSSAPLEPTVSTPPTTRTPATSRPSTPSSTTTPTAPTVQPPAGATPGALHTVEYSVAGEGRAISILYLDTGGIFQTEFNVMLPWSKQVQLEGQANSTASVSIVNVGREITCSITVDGAPTQQASGMGFTLCTSFGSG